MYQDIECKKNKWPQYFGWDTSTINVILLPFKKIVASTFIYCFKLCQVWGEGGGGG